MVSSLAIPRQYPAEQDIYIKNGLLPAWMHGLTGWTWRSLIITGRRVEDG
jgi:hypothetical protein